MRGTMLDNYETKLRERKKKTKVNKLEYMKKAMAMIMTTSLLILNLH
jgi:hypothetical protein